MGVEMAYFQGLACSFLSFNWDLGGTSMVVYDGQMVKYWYFYGGEHSKVNRHGNFWPSHIFSIIDTSNIKEVR
jgi:hypothetical protein